MLALPLAYLAHTLYRVRAYIRPRAVSGKQRQKEGAVRPRALASSSALSHAVVAGRQAERRADVTRFALKFQYQTRETRTYMVPNYLRVHVTVNFL